MLAFPASAAEILDGPVPARVTEVIDGDTLAVEVRIWLGQDLSTRVRLAGVDAPELRGGCLEARALAKRAKRWLSNLVGGATVMLSDIQFGKYAGRIVARVATPGGRDLSTALIDAGLGRATPDGARADWCPASPATDR